LVAWKVEKWRGLSLLVIREYGYFGKDNGCGFRGFEVVNFGVWYLWEVVLWAAV